MPGLSRSAWSIRRAEEVATGKKKRGRKPKVVESLPTEEAKANTTDPDSRIMTMTRQGYHSRATMPRPVVSEGQIIVAVGVTQEAQLMCSNWSRCSKPWRIL